MRQWIFILALVSASLACGQYVTPTAEAVQIVTPTAPATLTPSATPTQPAPSRTAEAGEVAVVRQVSVNVRIEPDGDPTGEYVYAGDRVKVLATATDAEGGEWVRIAEPAGWIWAGCLEGSQRGCIAE